MTCTTPFDHRCPIYTVTIGSDRRSNEGSSVQGGYSQIIGRGIAKDAHSTHGTQHMVEQEVRLRDELIVGQQRINEIRGRA
jgi:hypothetical protein